MNPPGKALGSVRRLWCGGSAAVRCSCLQALMLTPRDSLRAVGREEERAEKGILEAAGCVCASLGLDRERRKVLP